MVKVTLIGSYLAQQENEFMYHGPLQECKQCKLTTICFNLKPHHRYRIKKIRKKQHNCSVHQSHVAVVEVEQLPILTTIDKKYTKGAKITLQTRNCDHKLCPHYDLCTTPVIRSNQKYLIVSTSHTIDCIKNHSLQIAEILE